jgi:hypothetical protein
MPRPVVYAALSVIFLFSSAEQRVFANCSGDQPFFGSVSTAYTPKGSFSKDAKPEDVKDAEKQALLAAWNKYIGTCMDAGRMQEYLARGSEILGNLDNYLLDKKLNHKVDKKSKTITAEALLTVNQALIDGLFTQASGGGDGDGAYMVWIFAAKQAAYTAGGDTTTYDADVQKDSSSRNLTSAEIVSAQDDTTEVESTLIENNASSSSSGQTTQRGTETTAVIRDYELVSTADFSTKMSSVLALANYEPIEYVDLVNECGGEEPDIVEEELALNGKMSRETRKSVITAARDCEIEYLAIGTIDINQPRKSSVEGYNVTLSITGEVLSLAKRLPKKVAAIGPVQAQAGGLEDNTAVRSALNLAGDATANEIVSRLNAKGIN